MKTEWSNEEKIRADQEGLYTTLRTKRSCLPGGCSTLHSCILTRTTVHLLVYRVQNKALGGFIYIVHAGQREAKLPARRPLYST